MNEKGIFSQFERDELNKITAKSILEKLMNIRQHINVDFIARRLIWELIQNAKDNISLCSDEEETVDIIIQISDEAFSFSHNKGYFNNEHIRGLIRKYSSSDKERDTEQLGNAYKTTGRFGTGFMTTHLLSEKVKIESFYKNDNQKFNHFSFWLDRSGKSEPSIIKGINDAFDEAEKSIKNSVVDNIPTDRFKTSFVYPLVEQKKRLANIALEEVKNGIAYTLINVPKINSVTIDKELIGETCYKVKVTHILTYEEQKFSVYNLLINHKQTEDYFITIKNEEAQIIIPVSYNGQVYNCREIDSSLPRLHLDFPMIGTEDLNLPFIVNSSLFEPTEPRDGVSLIPSEDNEISNLNCSIVLKAVALYDSFFEVCRFWRTVELLR